VVIVIVFVAVVVIVIGFVAVVYLKDDHKELL